MDGKELNPEKILSASELDEQLTRDLNTKKSSNVKLDSDIFKPPTKETEVKRKPGRPVKIKPLIPGEPLPDLTEDYMEFDQEMGELLLNFYITKVIKSSELAREKESIKFAKIIEKLLNKYIPPEARKYSDAWNLLVVMSAVTYSRIDFEKKKTEDKKDETKKINDPNIKNA